jgi:phage terminase small subunit
MAKVQKDTNTESAETETLGELSPRMRDFAAHWVKNHNASKAAIQAGYSEKGAGVTGSRLLMNTKVMAEISRLQKEVSTRLKIDQDFVIQGFVKVYARAMQEEPILDKEGKETGAYKFDAAAANRSLELLGKHLGLFTEKVEHSGAVATGPVMVQVLWADKPPEQQDVV